MWSLQDFFFFEFLRGVEELFRVEFFLSSGFFECLEFLFFFFFFEEEESRLLRLLLFYSLS